MLKLVSEDIKDFYELTDLEQIFRGDRTES